MILPYFLVVVVNDLIRKCQISEVFLSSYQQ